MKSTLANLATSIPHALTLLRAAVTEALPLPRLPRTGA